MADQSVLPNHVCVLFKVSAQDDFNLRVLDSVSLDRIKQKTGIIEGHLPELSMAATVAVEGDAPKKSMALFINVEVSKNTVFLEAEAEVARPRIHLRVNSD